MRKSPRASDADITASPEQSIQIFGTNGLAHEVSTCRLWCYIVVRYIVIFDAVLGWAGIRYMLQRLRIPS